MIRGSPSRRFLTEPSEGTGNQGWDNKNSDLVIAVGDIFQSSNSHRLSSFNVSASDQCMSMRERS